MQIEYELDAAHRVMIEEMTDGETEHEEFVQQLVDQTIYSTYRQFKNSQQQAGAPATEELIEEAEPAE